ncbi:MAG: hypothetical protein KME07_23615 [Pegethrix bostrychoides GSE-TBD4-15B]|jgi:Ca2+-binding RTX toxin-like protein|uniref:Uncharacterized protein n=1 Tax=Pegethrix bostrychoides GSE-TBD4-15B TaxID=2839662 RepID=A0A951PEZ4_9CYAN|nr:hypothetical protein [Pegethrix bostrychoides GSE-TBD4-15B]
MSSEISRLTNADFSQSAFLPFANSAGTAFATIPSAAGISVTFDFYSYGGTGGDGLSFFLVDGTQPLTRAGGFGGSLGYAPAQTETTVTPGIAGGYLGIGFDEFGNFATGSDGKAGGTAFRMPNSITVRGSEATSYAFLGNVLSPIPLDNPDPAATQANSKRTAQVNLSPAGDLQVSLDINQNGLFTDPGETLLGLNVVGAGNGALPATFRFGFAASTGGNTNIHEVGNVSVKDASGNIIAANLVASLIVDNSNDDPTVDQPVGGSGNDIIRTGGGNDVVTGQAGNDIIVGGKGADTVSGGTDADRFYFSGSSKAEALRDSTLRNLDRITDFSFAEGDRFGLDFDNNLGTIERPKRLFNAGREKGSLRKAAKSAYADKNQQRRGDQALKANEAVFFRLGSRTFLSVNDSKAAFSATNDLLVDVTGIQFKPGDARKGGLRVTDYFI